MNLIGLSTQHSSIKAWVKDFTKVYRINSFLGEYILMRKRYKWRVIDIQDLGKHVGARIQTNAHLSENQGFFIFLSSPNLILCLGSTSPHVWQEMKSQSGTGAKTHLIERKPRCEFLSRLYLDTTIFPGIIPWFWQNLKNINISDTNGGLGLNPNWNEAGIR